MIQFDMPVGSKMLELGGGESRHPQASCNMDVRAVPGVDVVHDLAETPWPQPDAGFDLIYAAYILEHLPFYRTAAVLAECRRVLRPGGKLVLLLPDAEAQARWIAEHPDGWDGKDYFTSASELVYGSQSMAQDANVHRAWFTQPSVTRLLTDAGFMAVKTQPHNPRGTDMLVQAGRPREEAESETAEASAPEATPTPEPEETLPEVARMMESAEGRQELFGRDYFDGGLRWGGYSREGMRDFPVHEVTARYVLARKPESVLEVGAARGYVGKRIEDAGIPYRGMEISRHCWLTRVSANVYQHDSCVTPWPVVAQSHDLCFSIAVMEHIPEQFLPAVIGEMARTCKRGLHGIDLGAHDDGFDKTHCTLRPREWWLAKFEEHAPGWPVEVVDKEDLERPPPSGFPKDVLEGDGKVKLNLGCAMTMFQHGWVNVDVMDLDEFARRNGYNYLCRSLRDGLPYMTGTVDAIVLHHVLEHFDYREGRSLLRECRRVLKPGGALRVTVPNSEFLADLYVNGGKAAAYDERNEPYEFEPALERFDEMNQGCAEASAPAGKLHALLCVGHAALYDAETLLGVLREAGFAAAVGQFRTLPAGPEFADSRPLFAQVRREGLEMDYGGLSLFADATPKIEVGNQ